MAISARDRKIRLFNVLSGKIIQVIDDSLDVYSNIQQVFIFLILKKFFIIKTDLYVSRILLN